ncbi:hypothetical protein ACH0AH_13780 [Microbacterium paludicola]|uniref:hypothetical protein n=1 Tax=Microbacterium paludicola TaxID=300019 RepID=UPI00387A7330
MSATPPLRIGPVLVTWDRVAEAAPEGPSREGSHRTARSCGFREERRARGDALLAGLIAELAPGAETSIARRCRHCGAEDHGAPHAVAAPVVVSVSYAGRIVVAAAALTRDASAVGVDVERGTGPLPGLAPLFAPQPPPDRAGWTRIEAALKADGRGTRVPPGDVRFTEAGGSLVALVPGGDTAIEVVTLETAPPGCVLSLAILPTAMR